MNKNEEDGTKVKESEEAMWTNNVKKIKESWKSCFLSFQGPRGDGSFSTVKYLSSYFI